MFKLTSRVTSLCRPRLTVAVRSFSSKNKKPVKKTEAKIETKTEAKTETKTTQPPKFVPKPGEPDFPNAFPRSAFAMSAPVDNQVKTKDTHASIFVNSVFELKNEDEQSHVVDTLKMVATMLQYPAILKQVSDPFFTIEEKAENMNNIFEQFFKKSDIKLNDAQSTMIFTVVGSLMFENKVQDIKYLAEDVETMFYAQKKILPTQITSADELPEHQKISIVAKINSVIPEGYTILTTYKVDPSILGGLQLQIGDTIQDMSLRKQISVMSSSVSDFIGLSEEELQKAAKERSDLREATKAAKAKAAAKMMESK